MFWYEKAAAQGYAPAQTSLGLMYDEGKGAAQDYKQAVLWYEKAATLGNAPGQNNLGMMYAQGQGVARDYIEAYKWLILAEMNGSKSANKNRALFEKKMTSREIKEAQDRANEWLKAQGK